MDILPCSLFLNLLLFLFLFSPLSIAQLSELIQPRAFQKLITFITQSIISMYNSPWQEAMDLTNQRYPWDTTAIRGLRLLRYLEPFLTDTYENTMQGLYDAIFYTSSLPRDQLLHVIAWAPLLFSFQQRVNLFRSSRPALTTSQGSVEIKVRRSRLVEDTEVLFRSMWNMRSQFSQRFFVWDCMK